MADAKTSLLTSVKLDALRQARANCETKLRARQIGVVSELNNGIAWVSGLPDAALEELLNFSDDSCGIVFNLDQEQIGVVMLSSSAALSAGTEVWRTGRVADIPVGNSLLGRIINPLGQPLDGKGPLLFKERRAIEQNAPPILDRDPVKIPLQTGIKVIDALIPIGRGQRQLILGDRQTGKTALAVDTILNQHDSGVICIYCAIGQRGASLAKLTSELARHNALAYSVIIIAEGNEEPGLRYIAPYAATSIGEFFMAAGRDVLLIYDDLTSHAQTYREISLLLRRPPGREAFPGDIFYLHSRLLERSTRLRREKGGGSLTSLPIIQTEAQNLSAYIPTNLISITDGQIYLAPNLFQKGILPAIDVGKSVSRIGGKAQLGAYRSVAGALKLAYSQFEELEMFSRFGTKLDESTRNALAHGQRLRECLKQAQYKPLSIEAQLLLLLALTSGRLEAFALPEIAIAEQRIIEALPELKPEISLAIRSGAALSAEDRAAILDLLDDILYVAK